MDLWIRSQDREKIVKCCDDIYYYYDDETKEHCIGTYMHEIGVYKAKERALEVLDEIQYLLQNAYTGNSNRIVYEMPKE